MKAVYYAAHGAPDVLTLGELPAPEPEPGQVLVRVAAAGVNPIDRRLRNGELTEYISRTFPVIPGWDFSGRIERVGSEVSDWQVGDEVAGLAFTWSIQHGTYAEFVPVDASAIAHKPKSLSFVEAAALPLTSLTAWQALQEFGDVQKGQSVFIQAGAGGIGSAAIPMAKHLGAHVYTTCSAPNTDYVKARGADQVIDYTHSDYVAALREYEPDGLDLILETLESEAAINAAIKLVKPGGTVVYMNNEPPESPQIAQRGIKATFLHHRADGKMLAQLLALYADGTLMLPEIETLHLTDAVSAHEQSERSRTRGKLVLAVHAL
jgi:NADPH2:quinone reductase